eukprot:1042624_1
MADQKLFVLCNVIMIMSISLSVSALTWTTIDSTLPQATTRNAVGYHEQSNSVWLIGGTSDSRQLIQYHVDYANFTIHPILPHDVVCNSQSYVRIIDTLYIYSDETTVSWISSFNMSSMVYNTEAIPKPDALGWAYCLTNIDDRYLVQLGGRGPNGYFHRYFRIYDLQRNEWTVQGPRMLETR